MDPNSADIVVREESAADFAEYARVSIAFEVDRVLEVSLGGGLGLNERRLDRSYIKNYDAIAGNSPTDWPNRIDISRWSVLVARASGRRIGGAVAAVNDGTLTTFSDLPDVAVLWDIRVAPEFRGRGVGSRLFAAVENWARDRGCTELVAETQNINVAACRFYQRCHCDLRVVKPMAYPDLPDEVQLFWFKDLTC
jgi:GNAT superfamily N-acetyltransferase